MSDSNRSELSRGRVVLACLMMTMGVLHFTHAHTFASVMPPYLPWHMPLVYLSGVFEFALGLALLGEPTRVLAAWGLIALYVAVFPANLHMAMHPDLPITGLPSGFPRPSPLALWLRLPLQLAFIAWAGRYARRKPERGAQLPAS